MRRRFPRFALVSIFIFLALSLAAQAASGLLRLKPKEGHNYRYEMVTTQDMDMSLGPLGEQSTQTVTTMIISQTIREVRKDGTVAVDIEYEDVSIKIGMPDGEVGEAMGGDQGTDLTEIFGGHVIQVEYSERGEVLEVSGFSSWFEKLMEETGDQMPQMKQMLAQSFSDETIKTMMQQAMPVFPQEPPAVGVVWTHDVAMSHPLTGPFRMSNTYGYAGSERRGGKKCMRMDLKTVMEIPEELPLVKQLSDMMKAQGVKMDMDLSMQDMEGAGSLWTDKRSGMLVESLMNQRMDMEISMTLASTTEEEVQPTTMDMSIRMDQEIHMTLLP